MKKEIYSECQKYFDAVTKMTAYGKGTHEESLRLAELVRERDILQVQQENNAARVASWEGALAAAEAAPPLPASLDDTAGVAELEALAAEEASGGRVRLSPPEAFSPMATSAGSSSAVPLPFSPLGTLPAADDAA